MYSTIAILITLAYLVVSRTSISLLIRWITGACSYTADWLAWVLVVLATPTLIANYTSYEITNLTIFVFIGYSVVFMCKQILKMTFGDMD